MPKIAVSADFLDALTQIPRQQQKKVREFITKFQHNPTGTSINYETIHNVQDDRVRTVRIDLAYRAVVLHPKKGDVYTLLWVDHHDKAMAWARRKRFEVNPVTGALQVIDTEAIPAVSLPIPTEASVRPLNSYGPFEMFQDEDLLRAGIPVVLLPAVKQLKTIEALEQLHPYLPGEAYETLFWVAHLGYSIDQALNEVYTARPALKTVDVEDIEVALQHPDSLRRFAIVETPAELEEILKAPLEKWRVFLHPSQADLVKRTFNGPARVLGGAGTGKTVVAMHRARHLAREVFTDAADHILFITFTSTLAHNIGRNLSNLCGPERQRIEVVHLHKWAMDYLRSQGVRLQIASNDEIRQCWQAAIHTIPNAEFEETFYRTEWENIVKANRLETKEAYLRIQRRGQGSRLSRLQRAGIWEVFTQYQQQLKNLGKVEWNEVPTLAWTQMRENGRSLPYRAVVVDEIQDLFPEELRLVRQLVTEGSNDLFLVGDAHQRIHSTAPVVMHQCGINIRGRSYKLRINYRTTEKIRQWAMNVLTGISIDDMDGGIDELITYTSLRQGQPPAILHFNTLAEERGYLIEQIERLVVVENVSTTSICIVARESRQLQNYIPGLTQAGIPHLYLTRETFDDAGDGVRLATMHRVKGLEFTHIFIVGVNEGILPNKYILVEDEDALRERCLLHVAATRARDTLTITSYGRPSPFLKRAAFGSK